jgi:lipopolysaccharide transport system ATP-binding protein
MSSDLAIRVEGLGKAYTIRHQHNDHVTLAQVALDRAAHPFRRNEREELWALQDVAFEVNQGEVFGVIGRNGAGKSTLLKLLTRITQPTTGRIDLWGRVGSLLEIGTGFHPELTGRENVYLNGSILGMTRKEIDGQFDAIVDFAGVEKFLDTPVKRYSSGMYVRLAFAVAAHLETEILLLDEVLAVGDVEFQERCFRKVGSLASGGRAVVLVSHNLAAIRQFTTRCIFLEAGRVVDEGPTDVVVERYRTQGRPVATVDTDHMTRMEATWGTRVRITSVEVNGGMPQLAAGAPLVVAVTIRAAQAYVRQRVSIQVDALGSGPISHAFSGETLDLVEGDNVVDVTIRAPLLASGRYSLGLAVGSGDLYGGLDNLDGLLEAVVFEVGEPIDDNGRVGHWNPAWGSILYPTIEVTNRGSYARASETTTGS